MDSVFMLHWKVSLTKEKIEGILYHMFRISCLFFFFLLNKNYPSDVLVNRLHLYSCSRCWQTGFLGFARILINVTIYFSVLFSLIREKILPWCWKKWQKNGLIRLLHIFSLSYVNIWQSFIKNASEELTVFCWPSLGCAA